MEDEPRFEEFVAERADALLRYGYLLSGNPHDAADLTQEALVRLHISTWRLRRRERPDWALHETARFDTPPSDSDEGLWQALATLPRKQRAVLVLRYYEDLSDTDIADVLGISRGTVRSHASLGLAKLRSVLPSTSEINGSPA
ncbi:SigE family RNA polymerase sigma factor [Nonomuraea sp. SBT364]|uniref:SigE family RNA polymerase sigma factor n=1 Tax=Nonomuraea sp. SBT364 TaxID=1580530 RepID=UPI00066D67A5|nr:SigE family RNA polymerase sigma factor [Nonomuraea sp. SBT364]